MAHTPGPWHYQPLAGHHDFAVYAETTGHDIALVRDFDKANAQLIASAPDLLAALKQIAQHTIKGKQSFAASVALAVIAKAEGK